MKRTLVIVPYGRTLQYTPAAVRSGALADLPSTTTFLPLSLTSASPAVDHLIAVASSFPNHSSDASFVSWRNCAIIGTPRNGRPRTSSAISVPFSANMSVNACATGFTPPC